MSVRRSILYSTLDRYLFQLCTIATTAVMARILTPAETGQYLVVSALVLLMENSRSFGIGPYIVQERDLDRAKVRSAFTVTLIISGALWLAVTLSADAVAGFYGEPGLAELLRIAALGFLVAPIGGPIVALLQRDFAFRSLAIVNVAAVVLGSAATVGLGLAGFGAASFAWGMVLSLAVTAALATAFRPEFWIFRPSLAGVRGFLSFGSVSTLVVLLNLASDMLPRLVFGKILGFDAVGLYARAVTICQLPDRAFLQAVQPVVLPAMASRSRNNSDLKAIYLRGHAMMSAVQWPALLGIALLADPAVRILLGSQWVEAAPLVRLVSLSMMMLAPAFMTYPVLVATGRIRDTLTASLISLPASAAIMIAAAPFGLEAVAASALLVAPLQMGVALWFVRRAIGVGVGDLLAASGASLVLAGGSALGPGLAILLLSPDGYALDWRATALAIVGGVLGWLAALRVVRHPIGDEIAVTWRLVSAR